jgi:hypothetical protein
MKYLSNPRLLALALLLVPAAARAATFSGPPDTFYAMDLGTDKVFVRLNLKNAGDFTGTMDLPGNSHNVLKGTLDVSGSFSGVATPSQTPFFIHITGSTPSTYLLTGSAAGENLDGFPIAHVKGQTVAQQGLYTAYLAASGTSIPVLIGNATMRVSKAGAVMVSGKLPDGTSFTAGSNLVADGTFFKFAMFNDRTLYNKKGRLTGFLEFITGGAGGQFAWQKPATKGAYYPAPFSAVMSFSGFPFSKSVGDAFTSGTIEFIGGMLTSSTSQGFTVADKRTVTVNSPNPLNVKLSINGSTAAVRGSFNFPDSTQTLVKYSGILLQDGTTPIAIGSFRSPIVSGSGSFGYFEASP